MITYTACSCRVGVATKVRRIKRFEISFHVAPKCATHSFKHVAVQNCFVFACNHSHSTFGDEKTRKKEFPKTEDRK